MWDFSAENEQRPCPLADLLHVGQEILAISYVCVVWGILGPSLDVVVEPTNCLKASRFLGGVAES